MKPLQDHHRRAFQRPPHKTPLPGSKRISAATRVMMRGGCASHVKIRTAPQRERSDMRKVTRRLREHMFDFNKIIAHHEKWAWKMSKTTFCQPLFRAPFPEVYKVLRLPQKMSSRHPKCCACHTESSSCPRSKMFNEDSFIIWDFRPFDNVVQVHHILRLPLNMISTSTSHFDPRLPTILEHAESAAPATRMKSVRWPVPGTQNDVSKCPGCPTPATGNGHSCSSKNPRRASKPTASKVPKTPRSSCESLRCRHAHGHLTRELQWNNGAPRAYPDLTPTFNTYRKNRSGDLLLGEKGRNSPVFEALALGSPNLGENFPRISNIYENEHIS